MWLWFAFNKLQRHYNEQDSYLKKGGKVGNTKKKALKNKSAETLSANPVQPKTRSA